MELFLTLYFHVRILHFLCSDNLQWKCMFIFGNLLKRTQIKIFDLQLL